MMTDDFVSDVIFHVLREMARLVPALQGRASASPLEIMDETEKYAQQLDKQEQSKRIAEHQTTVRAEDDGLKEELQEMKELVCKHLSEEKLETVIELNI